MNIIKCDCGNLTNKVFTDFIYADPKRKEQYSYCYFCADGSDCWDEEDIPPSELIQKNKIDSSKK